MNAETTDIILKTLPFLEENGDTLTCHFYRRLFAHHPELRSYFNPAHQADGSQPRALAGAVCAYAKHIEDPTALLGAVELIAHKHVSLGVQPEHYPVVGEHLLASIQELLGDACTPEILSAWGEAYGVLADIFVQREAKIYGNQGWTGFKPFTITSKVDEGGDIVSFYCRPQDGIVQGYLPGQYITVRVPHPETGTSMRNYSLSRAHVDGSYRISVKRERASADGGPAGFVSNYLHNHLEVGDVLEIGAPCGEFTLGEPTDSPVALIAGGIGITPLLAMAQQLAKAQPERALYVIRGARSKDHHAFEKELRALADSHPNMHLHIRFDEASAEDIESGLCDGAGRIDAALLSAFLPLGEIDAYVCGPQGMMSAVLGALTSLGVAPERQHHEFFGPAGSL